MQLTNITTNDTYLPSSKINITYNYTAGSNNGKIGSATDAISGETVSYQYDALNRLISASGSGWTQTQAYDGFGNLTGRTGTGTAQGTTISTPTNATTNQLSGYSYDANGNLISTGYAYDAENRISSVNAGALEYFYDAQNKRIWELPCQPSLCSTGNWAPQGQTINLFGADGKQLASYSLGDTVVNNQVTVTFGVVAVRSYFGGRLVGQQLGANIYEPVIQDRLGSVGKYYPYGEERNSPQLPNDQVKFATYTRDSATGNDYADQRYYTSTLGRFMTPDPYVASAGPGIPQSWNRYAYAGGDPANRNDPFGQDWCEDDDLFCLTDSSGGMGPSINGLAAMLAGIAAQVAAQIKSQTQALQNLVTDCNAWVASFGFPGLNYTNASEIWTDGNLSFYSTDATAATIAALAAVTWQGESSFSLYPANYFNVNKQGVTTSIDYGPFQINPTFHPNSNAAVWGTIGAAVFDGNVWANINFGIQILEGLWSHNGNNAAARYVGSPINPHAQARQATWNTWGSALEMLFSNTNCFPHQ